MSTGVSIGTGAGQYRLAIAATIAFSLIAILISLSNVKNQKETILMIEISPSINLDQIKNILKLSSSSYTYLSMKKDAISYKISFSIHEEKFDELTENMKKLDPNCSVEIYRPQ